MSAPNYLIIGQGLAGTVFSYELHKRKISHKVLDNNHKTAATKAAAGIINPITGRRYVKSWMIEELLPAAKTTYSALEKLLSVTLVKERNILRALDDITHEKLWNESTSRPGYNTFVKDAALSHYANLVNRKMAYGEIQHGLQVAVATLIFKYKDWLIAEGDLMSGSFDYEGFDYDQESYSYDGETYDGLIFCDGYQSIQNPLFEHLPFQPAKGESLTVEVDKTLPDKLLRDNIFIAPLSENTFWTGGGYVWDPIDEQPTELFRDDWQKKLDNLLTVDYSILNHLAGVRPSVKGRRPLIGQHHRYKKVYLFNGLGTKGTSLAPYWAAKLADFLLNNEPTSSEVDINRFVT